MDPITIKWDIYGKFFLCSPLNCFLYKRNMNLELLSFSNEGHILRQQTFQNCEPDIPAYWQTSKADSNVIICGKSLVFYKDTLTPSCSPSKKIMEEYRANPYHLTDDPFLFGNYRIDHKGHFGFRCTEVQSGNKIWETTLNGYLYHDVVFFPETNSILFCTAGHGGGVYSIDIEIGKKLFEVKTGGTRDIVIYKNTGYCYRLGKSGSLLEFDIRSGNVTKEHPLHEVDLHSPLQAINNSILCTISRKTKNGVFIPILNGFELA